MGKQRDSVRTGRRYRPNRLADPYDVLVVGSGIGGLTAAACLSKMGKKVCVLEQHYTAGGFTHSYAREGYEWDVGVHYIGDVGAKTRTRRMFDYLTDGKLQWAPMDHEYDRFYVGDKVFNAVAGRTEFRDNLVLQFPAEEEAIDRYMALLSEGGKALSALGMAKVLKPWQRTRVLLSMSTLMPRRHPARPRPPGLPPRPAPPRSGTRWPPPGAGSRRRRGWPSTT